MHKRRNEYIRKTGFHEGEDYWYFMAKILYYKYMILLWEYNEYLNKDRKNLMGNLCWG